MLYRVRHQTIYDYVEPVSVSHHAVRLTPRDLPWQRRTATELSVWPVPPFHAATHFDFFGNTVTSFTLPESHSRLSVEATSELEVHALTPPPFTESPAWETVRDTVAGDHSKEGLEAYQFVFDSIRVSAKPELAAYARASFPPGRPLLEAVIDLADRIHHDSSYFGFVDFVHASGKRPRLRRRWVFGGTGRARGASGDSERVLACARCRRKIAAIE